MLGYAITLAIASFAFEMMIASNLPTMRKLAKSNLLVNLSISLAISYAVGTIFGAAGLTAMTAAIISTLMSIPGYQILEWTYDTEKAHAEGGNRIRHKTEQAKVSARKWKEALSDLLKFTYAVIKVFTFPIWFTRSLMAKIRR
jgi:hypothetical protein